MNQNNISALSVWVLSFFHILLIILSNLLVQYPFEIFGFHTTWGAFTYPAIFILTDLTVRLSNAHNARSIIFRSMFPGLMLSYLIASYIEASGTISWDSLVVIHPIPLRIAFACFIAYATGQLLDIFVFQRYRNSSSWWLAPVLSSSVGNLFDTVVFFSIAFYHSSNSFLSQHWPEIAMIDMSFKIAISLIAFIPVYGLVLKAFGVKFANKVIA